MENAEIVRKLLNNQLEIVLIFDDSGNVSFINEAGHEQLDFQAGQVNICEILAVLFLEPSGIAEVIDGIKGKTVKTVAYRKNNTCFSATIRIEKVQSDNTEIFNLVSILDILCEERVQKDLEKTESNIKRDIKVRNEIIANIVHELRTPVNGVKGHARNLFDKEENRENKVTLSIIMDCCNHMEKLINDLLDYSKIEAGKFEIDESPFEFRTCIKHVLDTNVTIANDKGLQLSAYVAEDIPEIVIGDQQRIIQVLNNLVSNALKFTSIGYVAIEVYKTRQRLGKIELTFFVIDSGIGITSEERKKIFRSFVQGDRSITRTYGGTGIGLYVTKQLIELMHGNIDVQSQKGKGSVFTFTIRVSADSESEESYCADKQLSSVLLKYKDVDTLICENKENLYSFGSDENKKEICVNLEKLMLSIEMQHYEKAEVFADNVKKLTINAKNNLHVYILKLQMAIRKEDYAKSAELLEVLKEQLKLCLPTQEQR